MMQADQQIVVNGHTHVDVAVLLESIQDVPSDIEDTVYIDETDVKTGEVTRIPVIL